MYEVTVSKVFSAAHAIHLPDGSLEPIHGHNWEVRVTVAASQLNQIEVVMDFHKLEAIVDQLLKAVNNKSLNEIPPFNECVNPTAERVAWWLGTQITQQLPPQTSLSCVSITEAPGCTATYRPNT